MVPSASTVWNSMSWTWTGWVAQATVLVSCQVSTAFAFTVAGLMTCGNGIVFPDPSFTPLLVILNGLNGWPLMTRLTFSSPKSKLNTRSGAA
jgi:hypothetical protein